MNKHNAKDYLPLVQALAEGKTLQLKSDTIWIDVTNPTFDWPASAYRIKPDPRWLTVRIVYTIED